ncbi:hypothetical protein [Duganella fentianensis]|uniref:hypothetical protein n=1 Tax=Duganella fentianensis TaxID=2692177 RepID=UPI0032B26CFA
MLKLKVKKKVRSAKDKRLALRDRLWPEVEDAQLWLRKERVGFTTIPRTMNLIGRVMDQLGGKGFPLFNTYLALWCRVYDEGIVEIRSDRELAFESGFGGPRGEITWRARMRLLKEIGFIDVRAGLASEMQYVLIYNPILVIVDLYEKDNLKEDMAFSALLARLSEVGANDLDYVDEDPSEDDDEL